MITDEDPCGECCSTRISVSLTHHTFFERPKARTWPRVEVQICKSLLILRSPILLGVSSSLLGPVDPSFRALSGSLKFTVRRHKFNKDSSLFVPVPLEGGSRYISSSSPWRMLLDVDRGRERCKGNEAATLFRPS